MICERFTLIVVCSALSNFAISSSWTVNTNTIDSGLFNSKITFLLNVESERNQGKNADFDNLKQQEASSKTKSDLEPQTQDSASLSDAETLGISKVWSLAAMGLTSGISLLLLHFLFRKPQSSKQTLAQLSLSQEQKKLKVTDNSLEPLRKEQVVSSVSSVQNSIKQNSSLPIDRQDFETTEIPTIENSTDSNIERNLVKINADNEHIDVVFELIQDLKHRDRNLRRKAIWELAKIGDSRCIEPMAAIMSDPNSVDRSLVVKAITQITHRSFKPINEKLSALLSDENPQVRINAVRDLATFYKFLIPVTQQLTQMQLDEDKEVRATVRKAIGELNLNSSVAIFKPKIDRSALSDRGKPDHV